MILREQELHRGWDSLAWCQSSKDRLDVLSFEILEAMIDVAEKHGWIVTTGASKETNPDTGERYLKFSGAMFPKNENQ